ncbi:MAG: UDP-N-acetylmuramoyl-L-alanine--D-glutamate ligase [Candidatus Cloacimonadales bacterium]|jgi:UDP-N-acetylmuramoylalanine--D-glutamate ligase|nr:UDP-N-acetylmuramoyl-L-alanine--D-glutamate ligase [Candidatus Cloacimonadota bacterium]MDD2649956.1 UDP-N-acetylmuramoyl-L-alanine--D-glutamate ligase [Candidatus Cloacimonadota bacterium]MDD3500901.1 UDP-N-acetylmuramoyl-L-alanine--D-glutamate ligase [Candidatus Cloacimonadota bacterium]MDX9976893.1 UDP-N-acetylmuramoyl-L-alanine--D-glutamate ligase [Candidatus Cloacimonadales bacterium]
MNFLKQRFSIIGIARSGIAAAEKIKKAGGKVFLSDSKQEHEFLNLQYLKESFICEFGINTDKALEADIMILSPGVPQSIPIVQKAIANGLTVISEIEFAYRIMNKNNKIIAVTGSNGKSTTVSLIYHLLKTAGYKTILAGNIGDAFSSFDIENEYDWIVLELSSFQLELIDKFTPNIAVLTNISPDHLNRYKSYDDYVLAKFNLFKNQKSTQSAIIFADDEMTNKYINLINSQIKRFSLKQKTDAYLHDDEIIINHKKRFSTKDSLLRGPHNYCNIMAALLAVEDANINDDLLKKGLSSFNSLEHRLEEVGTVNSISFINDSKATNTDSVKNALLSFKKPIRIILGGSDKGEDFSILTDLLKKHAKKVYLIGETKEKMINCFKGQIEFETFNLLETAVRQAFKESEPNDFIVLSPACASFDMFKNFEDRGMAFKSIFAKLRNENEKY